MTIKEYQYQYSDKMQEVLLTLIDEYPLIEFQVWEAIQNNYFVNHQIAHNTLFVEVEHLLESSIYEFLRDRFQGNVLLKPDIDTYSLYATDDTIIVLNLVTETPVNKKNAHHILLEKLLVDMMANRLVTMFVSKSEFAHIYEDAFSMYAIDESKMFRYARRRNAEVKIRDFIKNRKREYG